MQEEIRQPHIQWQAQAARPNPAAAWATALERVLACPPKRLPLKSHGYLKAIAYEIADELDKGAEKKTIAAERAGNVVCRPRLEGEPVSPDFDEIRRKIRAGRKPQGGDDR